MRMEHMMAVAAGYRRKPFIPQAYDLLTYVRLAGQEIYETGTEHDVKRIASVPDAGRAGGAYMQSTVANRPYAVQFAAGTASYFSGGRLLQSSAPPSTFDPLIAPDSHTIIALVFRPLSLPGSFQRLLSTTNALGDAGFRLSVNTAGRVSAGWYGVGAGNNAQITTGDKVVPVGTTGIVVVERNGNEASIRLNGVQAPQGQRTSPQGQRTSCKSAAYPSRNVGYSKR